MGFAKYREEFEQKKKEAAKKQQVKKTGFAAYREQLHSVDAVSPLEATKGVISAIPETSTSLSAEMARSEKIALKNPEKYAAAKELSDRLQSDKKFAAEYEVQRAAREEWDELLSTDVPTLEKELAALEASRPVYQQKQGVGYDARRYAVWQAEAVPKNIEIDKKVAELKKRIFDAKMAQAENTYSLIPKRSDFEQYSSDEKHKGTNLYDSVFGGELPSPEELNPKRKAEYYEIAEKYGENSVEAEEYLLTWLDNGVSPTIANVKSMTEDERNIFRYILNKEGEKAATDYLGFIQERVNARAAQANMEQLEEINKNSKGIFKWLNEEVSPIIHSYFTGAGNIGASGNIGVRNPISGAMATTKSQFLQSAMREDEDTGFWQGALMDTAGTIGMLTPSMIIGSFNPALGKLAMSSRMFSDSTNSALKEGKSLGDSIIYGVTNGAIEYVTSTFLGGIKNLSNQSLAKKLVPKIDKALAKTKKWVAVACRYLGNTVANVSSEAFEEWLQSSLDPIVRNVIFDENNEVNPFSSETFYEGLIGGLTALFLGGTPSASKQEDINRIVQATAKFSSDSVTEKRNDLARRMHEDVASITDKDINDLYVSVAEEIMETASLEDAESDTGAAAIRESLSREAQGILDGVLEAVDVTEQDAAANAFEINYLKGYLGKEFEFDSDARISAETQRAAFDLGKKAKASLGTVTVESGVKVSEEFKAFSEKLAKELHTHISIGGKAPIENGEQTRGYSTKYGELHIYEDAVVKFADGTTLLGEDAARVIILGHELTHRLQQLAPEEYKKFAALAVKARAGETGINAYMATGGYSPTRAVDEITADYAMSHLFYDERTISEVTKKHSKLAEVIRNIFMWIKEKLGIKTETREIDRAIRLWNDAYNASRRNARSEKVHNKNAAGEGVVKYSKDKPFEQQFEEYKSNRMGGDEFYLGETSEYLQTAKIDALPVVMSPKVAKKAQRKPTLEKHGHVISDKDMLALPALIKKPTMIFYSESAAEYGIDGRVLVLNKKVRGENGLMSPLFVALHLNSKQGFIEVNRIATVFGKDTNPYDWLVEQISRGNLMAYSKKEAERLLRSGGRQLPKENTAIDFDTMIPQDEESVNSKSMQKNEKHSGSTKESTSATDGIGAALEEIAKQRRYEATAVAEEMLLLEEKQHSSENGSKYRMDKAAFDSIVANFSDEYLPQTEDKTDERRRAVFYNRMYTAAVELATAYNTKGNLKGEKYKLAYLSMVEAARTVADEEDVSRVAVKMISSLLDTGYGYKPPRAKKGDAQPDKKTVKMNMALKGGWRSALTKAVNLADERRSEEYENAIAALKAEKQADRSEMRSKFSEEYAVYKEKFTEADTIRKLQTRIERNMTAFYRWTIKPDKRMNSVPEGARMKIMKIFERVDMGKDYKWKSRLEEISNAIYSKELIDKGIKNGTLPNSVNEFLPMDVVLKLNELTERIGSGSVYKMSAPELEALDEALTILRKAVVDANEIIFDGRTHKVDEIADEEVKRLKRLPKSKTKKLTYDFMDSLSFGETVGGTVAKLMKKLRDRFEVFVSAIDEVKTFTAENVDPKDRNEWRKSVKKITIGGKEVYVTDAQLMSLYMLSRRRAARDHLYGVPVRKGSEEMRGGGIRVNHRTLKGSGNADAKKFAEETKEEVISQVTPEEVKAACSLLSKKQKKVAEALGKFMTDVLGSMGNEVSMHMWGYRAFGETDYFTMNVAPKSTKENVETEKFDNIYAVMNAGMTKHLVNHAVNGLELLDIFDVFTSHTADMCNYYAFGEVLTDCAKIYNYMPYTDIYDENGEYIETRRDDDVILAGRLEETFPGAADFFKNIMLAFNGQNAFGTTELDNLLRKATSATKSAQMGANLRVIVQQPCSYLRTLALIDLKNFAKGYSHYVNRVPKELIFKYCPIAQWKSWGFYETDIGPSLDTLLFGERNLYYKAKDLQMKPAGMMDDITLKKIWRACEGVVRDQYEKQGKATVGEDEITYDMLAAKEPVRIVDIGENAEGLSYAELKKRALAAATEGRLFEKPYTNEDTGAEMFIGKDAFTHAFSNLTAQFGEDTVLATEHLPEIVKNAVLTNISEPKNTNKAETKVYTFFAAVKGKNGIEPVKLTVKEYDTGDGKFLPEKIKKYFEANEKQPSYKRLYDAKVLEVIAIEKSEPDASAADTRYERSSGNTSGSVSDASADYTSEKLSNVNTSDTDISITELLSLVKGDAEKYIPKKAVKQGTEEFYREVGRLCSQVIDETQVVDTPLHRVQAARSKSDMTKSIMSYTSEPMKELNMLYRAKKRGGKAFGRVCTVLALTTTATAGVKAVIDAFLRDDDEDKTLGEKYVAAFRDNFLSDIHPLSRIPEFGDDLTSWTYKGLFRITDSVLGINWSAYVPRTYDSSRYETAAIEAVDDLISALEKGELDWYDLGYKASKVISYFTGLGVSNLYRDFVGGTMNIINGLNPSPKGAYKRTLASGNTEKAKANYNAFLDAKCEELAKSKYGKEYSSLPSGEKQKIRSSAQSSIRTTTKNLFEDSYIKAWKKGDDAAITRIRGALLATDVYDMDDIKDFFESFVKSYYREQYKKAKSDADKEAVIEAAAKAKGRLIGDFKVFKNYAEAKKYLTS